MKRKNLFTFNGLSRAVIGAFALTVLVAFGAPQAAHASTSANATIYNQVTVEYHSGAQDVTKQTDVSLTVATLAAQPTVTVDQIAHSTTAGTQVTYTYTVRSNSNGPDTYKLTTPVTSINNGVTAPTNTLSSSSIALWGGIVVGSGSGFINLPGGSTSGHLTSGATVELDVNGSQQRYTVGTITPGNAASAGTAETYDQVPLTPVGNATAISATNVSAGTQVGQYTTFTFDQTAGTPTVAGADGTSVTDLTFSTTATDINNAVVTYATKSADGNEVTTTVQNPKLTITKNYRVVASGTAVPGTVVPANYTSTGKAKPGQVIEYLITIQNNNTNAASVASNVNIKDPLPPYTAYVAGSTYVGNGTTTLTNVSDVSGGTSVLTQSGGYTLSSSIAGNSTAYIVYQVQVQ